MNSEEVRSVSHELFGNRYMLEIVCAMVRDSRPTFTQVEISRATGIGVGQVRLVFNRLEKAGYVKRDPKDKQEQPMRRIRPKDPLWIALPSILDEIQRRESSN